eukprot:gnl/TRDRNA2_/TRDRNA2_147015_c0_seq1.p1 gnl/TRDRNA2_/TRDRNA2_147015_c0~~gnl/TRDRNA2_/TRDRNA2_147015_c0_seq1.p1  ORF type:complete len:239 (-),score=38.55 gnl/TRDRNA2_/TRDRNA2_147015_c0_seq1:35-751(-)
MRPDVPPRRNLEHDSLLFEPLPDLDWTDWLPWRCWVCQARSAGGESQNEVSVTPMAEESLDPSQLSGGTERNLRSSNGVPIIAVGEQPYASGALGSPRDTERAMLREVMKNFVHRGQQGVQIDIVDGMQGSLKRGTYQLDGGLQHITVKEDGADSISHVVMMKNLVDVHRPEDAGSLFPRGVLMRLSEDQKTRLILMQHRTESQEKRDIFLLEVSPMDRQRFLMCIKILRRYVPPVPS